MTAILNCAILNLAILDSATLVFPLKLTHTGQDWFPPFEQKKLHSHFPPHHCTKKPSLIHSDSTWWWQQCWILPCWIKKLHSIILTQLDDGSHLEFGHLGFSHLSFSSQTHSHLPGLVPTICTKKTSLPLPSPPFAQKNLHSFILTQLDDGSNVEFYLVGLKNFTHSFWLNLMMAAILNSTMLDSDTAILDSDTLFSSLRFTQKHSHSTLTLTQTNSFWLKLIHSHTTWWWQPSWILPSWIWPSWIQPS